MSKLFSREFIREVYTQELVSNLVSSQNYLRGGKSSKDSQTLHREFERLVTAVSTLNSNLLAASLQQSSSKYFLVLVYNNKKYIYFYPSSCKLHRSILSIDSIEDIVTIMRDSYIQVLEYYQRGEN